MLVQVAILATAAGSARAERFTLQAAVDLEQVEDGDELQAALICADAKSLRPLQDKEKARYAINVNGTVELATRKAEDLSFQFNGFDEKTIARVEVVPPPSPLAPPATIWCQRLTKPGKFEVPQVPAAATGSTVLVTVYGLSRKPPAGLADEQAVVLAAAQRAERDAVHASKALTDLLSVVEDVRLKSDQPSNGSVLCTDFSRASNVGHAALSELENLVTKWRCPSGAPNDLMAPAVCDELSKVSSAVVRILSVVDRVHARISTHMTSSDSCVPKEGDKLRQLVQALDGNDTLIRDYYEKLPADVAGLQPGPPVTSDSRLAQCRRLGQLRWLHLEGAYRLLTRAMIPSVPSEQLSIVSYGGATESLTGGESATARGFVVNGVPAGQRATFTSRVGKNISVDAATVVSTLVKIGIPQIPGAPRQLAKEKVARHQVAVEQLNIPSLLCDGDVKAHDREELALVIDPAVGPVAGVETLGHVFPAVATSHVTDFVLCTGTDCTGADDDKTVRARASVTPDRTGSWLLLAEVTFGLGFGSAAYGSHHLPLAIQNAPAFVPVGGNSGPDQLYEMQLSTDPRNAFSTSLIVGFQFADHWYVGGGPALLAGTSGALFKQWGLRVGYRLGESPVHITFGPTVRFVDVPTDYAIGDQVSVTRGSSGSATAPAFRTYASPEFQADIGIALDLGALGTAAADTVKAFGGK